MRLIALIAVLTLAAGPSGSSGPPELKAPKEPGELFRPCHDQISAEPAGKPGAECFFAVALDGDYKREAVDALTPLIARHPNAGWLRYYRGRVLDWGEDGERDYQAAAELFSAQADVSGEIRARSGLVTWMGFDRRFGPAAEQLEILRLLATHPAPVDQALVLKAEAEYEMLKGGDLDLAYRRLLRSLDALLTVGPPDYRDLRDCYRSLVDVTLDLGLDREANHFAEKAKRLAEEFGNLRDQTAAGYNAIDTRLATELPSEDRRRSLVQDVHAVLLLAQEAGYRGMEAETKRLIAELEGGPEAEEHLQSCRRLARTIRDSDLEFRCLMASASQRLESKPDEARPLLQEAYVVGLRDAGPWTLLFGWANHLRVLWGTQPPEQALDGAEAVLDAIETMRLAQVGDASDRLLSVWADAYYWTSGRLLEGSPGAEELAAAFQVMERLRAQTLREILESDRTPPPIPPQPLIDRQEELTRELVEVYRTLLSPSLSPDGRRSTVLRLDELERQQKELDSQTAALGGSRRDLDPLPQDLLQQVQANLAEDEALLSFQLGLWRGWDRQFAGGAYVLATTRTGTRAYPVPSDRASLEPMIKVFLGLSEQDRPRSAARLYRELLQPALEELPAGVRKLILVPDGLLHLLPFSLLRPSPESPPLIENFTLQTVPSATLWLHWRKRATRAAPTTAGTVAGLVFANPELGLGSTRSSERTWALRSGTVLGPLPYAELEGKKVLRHLKGSSRLVSGAAASEDFLKRTDLVPFSVVHFAAHAVVDTDKPGRSAILLASTDNQEDGFLRPSEIAELNGLDGKLVVLSSCDTASGDVLRGEGALSLARSFFEAGAHAVVASLWPLDDKLATEFFDDFYGELSRGASVVMALTTTQRRWIARDRPASMWAGVVVQGNGELVPMPGGTPESELRPIAVGLALLLASVVALGFLRRSRSS